MTNLDCALEQNINPPHQGAILDPNLVAWMALLAKLPDLERIDRKIEKDLQAGRTQLEGRMLQDGSNPKSLSKIPTEVCFTT